MEKLDRAYITRNAECMHAFNDGLRSAYNVRVNIMGYNSLGNVVESGYDIIKEIPAKDSRTLRARGMHATC